MRLVCRIHALFAGGGSVLRDIEKIVEIVCKSNKMKITREIIGVLAMMTMKSLKNRLVSTKIRTVVNPVDLHGLYREDTTDML